MTEVMHAYKFYKFTIIIIIIWEYSEFPLLLTFYAAVVYLGNKAIFLEVRLYLKFCTGLGQYFLFVLSFHMMII